MPSIDPSATTNDYEPVSKASLAQRIPIVVADKVPATKERLPALHAEKAILSPGVGRADVAVSVENPDGDTEWSKQNAGSTPLQMHVSFWDKNGTGVISPIDTYRGFRELGFNPVSSALNAFLINSTLSYPTRLAHSWIPDILFRIYVGDIHRAKHGSDSNTYDHEGRFVPQEFENTFSKYDADKDGALSVKEILALLSGNRNANDFFGAGATALEWFTLWMLVQKDGKVWKEDLRAMFDGHLFFKVRDAINSPEGWNQGASLGKLLGTIFGTMMWSMLGLFKRGGRKCVDVVRGGGA